MRQPTHQRISWLEAELLPQERVDGLELVVGADLEDVVLHDGGGPDRLEEHDDWCERMFGEEGGDSLRRGRAELSATGGWLSYATNAPLTAPSSRSRCLPPHVTRRTHLSAHSPFASLCPALYLSSAASVAAGIVGGGAGVSSSGVQLAHRLPPWT